MVLKNKGNYWQWINVFKQNLILRDNRTNMKEFFMLTQGRGRLDLSNGAYLPETQDYGVPPSSNKNTRPIPPTNDYGITGFKMASQQ